jgi:AcrR family transcriptional regulator
VGHRIFGETDRSTIHTVTEVTDGARARLLATASRLFYDEGIRATGVEKLARTAGVSKRTLYEEFGTTDQLVAACLQRWSDHGLSGERNLDRTDVAPRERLLSLFDRPRLSARFRGCPLHNTAVELSDPDHPGRPVIVAHKRALVARLTEIAREAGAADPGALAGQLATLYEGATALATSLDDAEPFDIARAAAVTLCRVALA